MDWLLSPLTWMLLAGALAALACFLSALRPWLLAGCGLLAAVAVVAMTPAMANALMRTLERSVAMPRACLEAPPSLAIVLAGGVDAWFPGRADPVVLNLASRRRIDRAAEWWRQGDGRMLVMAGGTSTPGMPAIAGLMAAYAGMLGVPPTAIRLESESRDTWATARHAATLEPRLPRRIVLVTSLAHMPRAQSAFVHAGFDVCPLGTDVRRLPSRLPWALVPRTSALNNTETAVHEWVGLVYYRWRERREREALRRSPKAHDASPSH